MRRIVLIAVALGCAAASGQVYKWTDGAGRTHYGDRPPEDAKTQELKLSITSYEGPPQVVDWGAVIRRKSPHAAPTAASTARTVTMYSTSWCGVCRHARAYFAEKGIAYTDIDVEKSEEGRKEYEKLGVRGVPAILVGDKLMRGFAPAAFEKLWSKS